MSAVFGQRACTHHVLISGSRVDLALAMRTGDPPLLFAHHSLTWKPYLADDGDNPSKSPFHPPWNPLLSNPPGDIRLANIYLDLHEFTRSLNLAHQTGRNIPPVLFQEVLISAQYRLHHLAYDGNSSHDDVVQEALRIAMLAFSAGLFLCGHSLHCRPPSVCEAVVVRFWELLLGEAFRRSRGENRMCLELKLCLLMLGRMSVLDRPGDRRRIDEEISSTTRRLGPATWPGVRSVLKGFLWVDFLHDGPGERIFFDSIEGLAAIMDGRGGGVGEIPRLDTAAD
jgi:hypothetical protein